jgi:type IV secretory pathway protease TraF
VQVSGRRRWAAIGAVALAMVLTAGVAAVAAVRARGSGSGALGTVEVPAGLGLRCSLPVVVDGGRLAMVSLPDGRVTAAATQRGPYDEGDAYARGRWLPVQPSAVSPDGRSYAFASQTTDGAGRLPASRVMVHDVASGRDREVWNGDGQAMVLEWSDAGIAFERTGADLGAWLVDPGRPSSARRVGPHLPGSPAGGLPPARFGRFGRGAAWGVTSSASPSNGAVANDLVQRLDLADGAVSTWYQAPPGRTAWIIAMDAGGRPLVAVADAPRTIDGVWYASPATALLLLSAPGQATPVALPDPNLHPDSAFSDAHGTWVTAPGSLWLYRDGRLVRVARVPAGLFPASRTPSPPAGAPVRTAGALLSVAGPCA